MLFAKTQLKSEEFLEQIKNRAGDMMIYDQVHEASDLITFLERALNGDKDFKDKNYYLYTEYKKIIIKLEWLILPIMTDEEVLDLFKNHFTRIYEIPDYDIWQKLRAFLLGFIVFQDRDNFKKELRQALLNNQEKLTNKKLIINNQEKMPTVGSWILDYNSSLGAGVADNLKRIQYFTNNNNIKKLGQEEKNKVKLLLDLYEKLKLSSFTLEGLEEDIPIDEPGKEGIIRGGVFEPLPRETEGDNRIKELNLILGKYPPNSLERKAIEEEMERLNH